MERAALSRRPPGFSGAGALTMEQAKISSARGTPAAQPTRAPAPGVADADDGTPATGFAAWLGARAGGRGKVFGGGGGGRRRRGPPPGGGWWPMPTAARRQRALRHGWRRWLP